MKCLDSDQTTRSPGCDAEDNGIGNDPWKSLDCSFCFSDFSDGFEAFSL